MTRSDPVLLLSQDELGHFTNGRSKSRSGASASPKDGESKPSSSQSAAAPPRTGPASSSVSLESVVKHPQEPAERQNLDSVVLEGDQNNAAAQEGGRGQFGAHDQESAQAPQQGDGQSQLLPADTRGR